MAYITVAPVELQDGQELTRYFGTAKQTSETHTYRFAQDNVSIKNMGNSDITVTVNSASTTINQNRSALFTNVTNFSVTASQGRQDFMAESWAAWTAGGGGSSSPSNSSTGNIIAAMGDSITIGNGFNSGGSINSFQHGDTSWFTHALLYSGGKLKTVGNMNAGISGQTSAQMLPRLQTDIIAKAPKICAILAGTNDATGSTPIATTLSNIESMINQLISSGITPVLCTIPPNNGSAGVKTNIVKINVVIQSLAQKYKLNLVDFYSILVDPATGGFLAGLFADATHPNAAGAQKMGQAFASQIPPLLPNNISFLPAQENDGLNKIAGGLFTANTAGLGTGWTITGTGANTPSIVTDANILGNWQEVFKSVSDANSVILNSTNISTNGSSGLNAGERALIALRIQTSGIEAGAANFSLRFWIDGAGGGPQLLLNWSKDITNGIMCAEFVLPAPNFTCGIRLTINAGVGRVRIAQVGVYGLTALGL